MKPILFSTSMVQAIFEGRKTMTRRIVKSKHESGLFVVCKNKKGEVTEVTSLDWDECPNNDTSNDIGCKYRIGDVLWVRETFYDMGITPNTYAYKTDFPNATWKWKPSIYMPKAACRLFLEITDRRIERLLDITGEDCKKEGVKGNILEFKDLWESINGAESWNSNPFVWVITFKQITK